MPTFINKYWDTNTAPVSGQGTPENPYIYALEGGSDTWSTSAVKWTQNGDGSPPHNAWVNGTEYVADFSSGGGTITLGTNITTGQIYTTDTCTFVGGYILTVGSALGGNGNYNFFVPVTSSTDEIYGLQAFAAQNIIFYSGLHCNAYRFSSTTTIYNHFETFSNTVANNIDGILILNTDANINNATTLSSNGSLTISNSYTASFNNFLAINNNILCNGLLVFNGDTLQIQSPNVFFSGSGDYNINGHMYFYYGLTKSGTGTLFISGNVDGSSLTVSEGILKTNIDITMTNDIVCSGTLHCSGNLTVGGNVSFSNGILRLGT